MKLTMPQKRALVALCELATRGHGKRHWRGAPAGTDYFTRYEINSLHHVCGSVLQKTMHALRDAGLVTPESELVVELVRSEICRCGCDRWAPTEAGRRLVATWNVRWASAREPTT